MTDRTEQDYRSLYEALPPQAKEVLCQLCRKGPTYDGDVVSKYGRTVLLELGYAAKVVMGTDWICPRDWKKVRPENEQGFQAATYLGSRVYRYGVIEPRRDIVRKLVGVENVRQ